MNQNPPKTLSTPSPSNERATRPGDDASSEDANESSWLKQFIEQNGGVAGTVHHLAKPDLLALSSSHNIPPPVLAAVQTVPCGKGMAGLALERAVPVSTCNLQTDRSGDVRPGARAVQAQAAVALPVLDEQNQVRTVVGIAFGDDRSFDEATLHKLQTQASELTKWSTS